MSALLSADLSAACSALGFFDADTNKYYADANTLETLKDLIRYLRRDDENHDIRRQLGDTKVLQTDLLPLLKSYWEETDLFDVLLRLIVNLTTPALILWNEELPTEKTARNLYLQIEGHLQVYKEAFADEAVWAVLSIRLSKILEIEYLERGDENSLIIERILILIRNILYVPADSTEQRPDNDASVHDQVLWALHQSGTLDIILYMSGSSHESAYYLHILEILSFMLREQKPSELASAALQRSQMEKVRDEAELLAIRHRETREKQKKTKMLSGTRHSRFGGTFVVKAMKSISDNELIYHKPLSKLDGLNFDADKIKPKTPKNRLPIKSSTNERRSAFSIRLFLKEFCVEFVSGAYNSVMHHVKDNLVRAKAQAHDESYYLWAMRFFMEFNRCHKFQVEFVSETFSVQTFHYVQQQSENYFDMMTTDKKKLKLWSRRLHLAVLAYRELFYTLATMDKSSDRTVRESSKVIKSNVFYVLEYREFILTLLVNYDELKMSDVYLKDLMETQHIFLKMLESFVSREGTVVVQSKARGRAKKRGKNASKKSSVAPEAFNVDAMWDEASPQLSSILETTKEFPSDLCPFDAASDVPIDDQKADAMKNIQRKLRAGDYEKAIGLLHAAREVWPEKDSFGSPNMAPEEEFLALRDIFIADLGENQVQSENVSDQSDDNDNEEDDEEDDAPQYNESSFKFKDFANRLAHPKIVRACGLALRQFQKNSVNTNQCIIKLLHRIAFDCKMSILVFQLSIFRTFQKIFEMQDLPQYKELVKFATYIVRQFVKLSETNKKLFMEALFWKSTKECFEIETGYTESNNSAATQRAWSEEQEDELRHLFMEHKNSENQEDVVDWIAANLVDQSKSRKQVMRKLKELMLLVDYKGRKKSSSRPPKNWSAQEEVVLQELFEQYRESDDPLGNIMEKFDIPRPRNRIVDKLLVMGLIQDKKELRKTRNTRPRPADSDSLASDSDDDTRSSSHSQKRYKKPAATKTKKSSLGKKPAPASRGVIAAALIKLVDNDMQEALGWLRESLSDAIEDYEVENNEGIPLVPVMDYAETAMEKDEFQKLLKGLGVCPPENEQEVYWRVPSHLTPKTMQGYCDLIQQALDKTLQINDEETESLPNEEDTISSPKPLNDDGSSDEEDFFSKLRNISKETSELAKDGSDVAESRQIMESAKRSEEDKEVNINKKKSRIVQPKDDESDAEMNTEEPEAEPVKENSISKRILESDSEEDGSQEDKRHRSVSDSDAEKPEDKEVNNIKSLDTSLQRKSRIIQPNDDNDSDAEMDTEEPEADPTEENSISKKSRRILESDSEEEKEEGKRGRSVSDSDAEKPAAKRGRILDSDDED